MSTSQTKKFETEVIVPQDVKVNFKNFMLSVNGA